MDLVVDGRKAYAYTGGRSFDPGLPCIVFVHGALNDHCVWTLAARWFAHHGFSSLAVDLPGHGRSDGPPPASVEDAAAWLAALLDAAQVAKLAGIAGHSLGSLIALESAARDPGRFAALALVATAYPMAVSQALLSAALDDPLAAIDKVTAWSLSTIAAKPSYPAPGSWLHGGLRALMRRILAGSAPMAGGGNLFHHDFMICDAYRGGQDAAARITARSTLILAAQDQMTRPTAARELAAALKAQVVTLPGGHALMQEQPDGLLAALRQAFGA